MISDLRIIATFIPFDLEATFSSGIIVLLASFVEPILVGDVSAELAKTHSILDDLIMKGNLIAARRKVELQQLESLLDAIKAHESIAQPYVQTVEPSHLAEEGTSTDLHSQRCADISVQPGHDPASIFHHSYDEWTSEAALDAEQLMNVVGLIDMDQLDAFSADFNF